MLVRDVHPLKAPAPMYLTDSGIIALSREFFGAVLLYGPTLTSIHDYWKNHSFDYMDHCQQSDVSAFEYAV